MSKTLMTIAAAVALLVVTPPAVAQDHSAHAAQATPAAQAFEHYEGVRKALSADNLADAAPHAKQLAASIEAVAGAGAKKHADALAAARDIEDARKQFGELSAILVPLFQAEAIPGTAAYMCPMKQKPWMQRGDKMANPYYGKAMLTCGTVLPPKAK